MATTFYLRNYPAGFPCPLVKQSADTIYSPASNPGGDAKYTDPQSLSITPGTKIPLYQFFSDEPGTPHYHYFGTFVSDPLPSQTIGGTVTVGLHLVQGDDPIATIYARIKVYKWTADNRFGSDLLALTSSEVAVPYWLPVTTPTVYFTSQPITTTAFNTGDKLVIEVETFCNHSEGGIHRYWLEFDGPTSGNWASYITFSQDIKTALVPVPLPTTPVTPLTIYDSTMSRKAVIDDYEYLAWARNWYTSDTWQMRINKNKPNADYILSSRHLNATTGRWEYGGFVSIKTALGQRFGMIDRIELSLGQDGKGSEQYLISGKGIEGILGTRIALYGTYSGDGFDTQTAEGETLLRHYVARQCVGAGGTLPIASFFVDNSSGNIPLSVTVTNHSSGSTPLTYAWDYTSDGIVESTDETPAAISYTVAGTYTLKLTVTNPYGTSVYTQQIRAQTGTGTVPITDFSASLVSGIVPMLISFTDLTINTPTSWLWSFGDGTTSTLQNPTHTYNTAGSFTVSLTATNGYGSDTETKTGYITITDPGGLPTYGAPSSLNGYAIGGALQVTAEGFTFGGGVRQYPITTGDYTVYTRDGLELALTQCAGNPGKTIYIHPSAAPIDMGDHEGVSIPAGTTLASNRGSGGSLGGKIYTTTPGSSWNQPMFKVAGNNVHITGLRLEGECYPEDYEISPATFRVGIQNPSGYTGFEVDNCELRGFAYACLYILNTPTSGRAWIHHNWIHGSQNKIVGYGVNVRGGDCLIEGNVFDRNRHSVTGEGIPGERYTVRYNKILGNGFIHYGTHLDVHRDENQGGAAGYAGYEYHYYNNTIENSPTCAAGNCMGILQLMWTSQSMVYFHHNLINADWGSGTNFENYSMPVHQVNGNTNTITCSNNYWKGVLYAGNYGMVFF